MEISTIDVITEHLRNNGINFVADHYRKTGCYISSEFWCNYIYGGPPNQPGYLWRIDIQDENIEYRTLYIPVTTIDLSDPKCLDDLINAIKPISRYKIVYYMKKRILAVCKGIRWMKSVLSIKRTWSA